MLNLVIGLDSSKKINIVTTYKILEFLGDWGGFREALSIAFSTVGIYFSSQFFRSDLISSVFKYKTTSTQDP